MSGGFTESGNETEKIVTNIVPPMPNAECQMPFSNPKSAMVLWAVWARWAKAKFEKWAKNDTENRNCLSGKDLRILPSFLNFPKLS